MFRCSDVLPFGTSPVGRKFGIHSGPFRPDGSTSVLLHLFLPALAAAIASSVQKVVVELEKCQLLRSARGHLFLVSVRMPREEREKVSSRLLSK